MSFNNYANSVRNSSFSMNKRRSSLKQCIRLFSYLTNSSYNGICGKCDEIAGVFSSAQTDDLNLHLILNKLIRSRNKYLEKLYAIERKRIRQKLRGQRHMNKADIEFLKNGQEVAASLE